MIVIEKVFHEALLTFKHDHNKVKRLLKDKRLSQIERDILEAHFLRKKNKNSQIIQLLEHRSEKTSDFIESQRNYILGLAYNHLSNFSKAEYHLQKANILLKDGQLYEFQFAVLYILFWVYANLQDEKRMKSCLMRLDSMGKISQYNEVQILRAKLCFYQLNSQVELAIETIDKVNKMTDRLTDAETISFLTDKFIFYSSIENFKECYKILNSMKEHRSFQLTENYNYMKTLLLHILDNSPIYAYENDYKNAPFLFYQLKVIQLLDAIDVETARIYWEKLQQIQPNVYLDQFEHVGEKNIFSYCLKKAFKKVPIKSQKEVIFSRQSSKIKSLIYLFEHNRGHYFSMTEIFTLLWGNIPHTNVSKVARLIYRIRKETDLEIVHHGGKYKSM